MNKQKRRPYLSAFIILVVIILLLSLGIKFPSSPKSEAVLQSKAEASATETYQPRIEPQVVKPPSEPIPAQLVIQFAHDTTQQERAAYIESIGGTVLQNIDSLDTVVLTVPEEVAQEPLPESPVVEQSEPDYFVAALDDISPVNDPRYAEQWALPAIGAPEAWAQLPADAAKVIVAVIDSGICASHPDLAGRIVDGWDFLESDAVPQDDFGHGCSVSGVIAANMNDGIGIAGVAPNAQVMPLRVLNASGVGSYSDVAAAIVYAADNGAQVINLSLGGSNPSTTLENAVNYAISKGVIIVAAAGNSGTEGALYPAAYPDVIAVGAVDPDLQYSSFSNYGSQIDIWAPGRDILTTKRDGSYGLVSGTSFAAPYVAGAEAIALKSNINLVFDRILILGSEPSNETPIVETPNLTASATETQIITPMPSTSTSTPVSINTESLIPLVVSKIQGSFPELINHEVLVSASDIEMSQNWAFGIAVVKPSINDEEPDLILFIGFQQINSWIIALEGTQQFNDWVTLVPEAVLSQDEKYYLNGEASNAGDGSSNLSLPWATGETWTLTGGAHNNAGCSNWVNNICQDYTRPWSSLDFQGPNRSGKARAAGDGSVYRSASCPNYIQINHANGWQTGYYHLANEQVSNGQPISRGTILGDISTQAGCGGTADGPHVHFSLRQNNIKKEINNLDIGGWTVHEGNTQYTGNLTRIRDGYTVYQWGGVYNEGQIGSGGGGGGTTPQEQCSSYPFNGITLFSNVECRDNPQQFGNTGFTNLPNFNDQTRSINVASGWSVRIWEHNDRGGTSRCMDRDFWDLTKLDFIQMVCLKRHEQSEERGKQSELPVVFGCWSEIRMLEKSVV